MKQSIAIDQLLTKETVVFMFKQQNDMNPIEFKNVFIKNEFKNNTKNCILKRCCCTVCN